MSSPARSISQRATERVMAAPGFRRASRRLPVRDSGFPTESRSMQGNVERRSRRATCSPSAAAQNLLRELVGGPRNRAPDEKAPHKTVRWSHLRLRLGGFGASDDHLDEHDDDARCKWWRDSAGRLNRAVSFQLHCGPGA